MISGLLVLLAAVGLSANPVLIRYNRTNDAPQGVDVSNWQGNVDWNSLKANGIVFAYIKATEGTGYVNEYFAQQYIGSYNAGIIRGSYHFARPDVGPGNVQADYFVANGGGWSADGMTLPGALDIEYDPYSENKCYSYSQGDMVNWIKSFSDQYHARTGRFPVIYSTYDWWNMCTGNSNIFGNDNPLWIANYGSGPGTIPAGWGWETFWQYTDKGLAGDGDIFNGDYDHLKIFAKGG